MSDEQDQGIKVTDRRMFTETGELREEFEDVAASTPEPHQTPDVAGEATASADDVPAEPLVEEVVEAVAAPQTEPEPETQAPAGEAAAPEASHGQVGEPPPGYGDGPRQPQFLDLVAMLAEPAALFLGDASMPGQEPMEDLDRARMHIDLLGLLESKCAGNLTEQESLVLSDLVYRLRLRYVEKKG